ncbi:secreted protein containing Cellulosome anchoring protein, cohesin region domain protein, partial [Candidatus Magnetomorum sp. HK-1]
MKKLWGLCFTAIMMTFMASMAFGFDINPADLSGDPGSQVVVQIDISNVTAAFESDAVGFTLEYDSNVLTYVSVDKSGTLLDPFTMVNGSENTPGLV